MPRGLKLVISACGSTAVLDCHVSRPDSGGRLSANGAEGGPDGMGAMRGISVGIGGKDGGSATRCPSMIIASLKSTDVIVGRRKGEKKLVPDERRRARSPVLSFFL